ncbi:MAG: M50 family metallopeptidase [Bdellovibrionota bacterium]
MTTLFRFIRRFTQRVHPGWLVIGAVLFVLWDTPAVTPLKLFVVFLHELSHALAGLATGGSVVDIQLDSMEGGVTHTLGGSRLVTLGAGYLGSLLWGGCIMLLAARTSWDRRLSVIIGSLTLALTVFYVRNLFGLFFGASFGIALVLTGFYLPLEANDILLRFVGFTSCVYAVLDIKSDILDRSIESDASMLAELTGIPRILWGIFWIALALIGTASLLSVCGNQQSRAGVRSTKGNPPQPN